MTGYDYRELIYGLRLFKKWFCIWEVCFPRFVVLRSVQSWLSDKMLEAIDNQYGEQATNAW